MNYVDFAFLANAITDFIKYLGGAINLMQYIGYAGMIIGAIWVLFVGRGGGTDYSKIVGWGIAMLILILLPVIWKNVIGKDSVVEPTSIEEAFGE